MSRLISVPSTGGKDILVEVDVVEYGKPVTRGGGSETLVQKATTSFEEGLARVTPVAAAIIHQLKASIDSTESIEVKFGMKFNAESGVFIAKAAGEASVEVTVKWGKTHGSGQDSS